MCRVYFLTTYREEGFVGKLVCLYFLTTYGEEGLVGKLVNFRLLYSINTPSYCSFLTTYTEEAFVGKRAHGRQWALP